MPKMKAVQVSRPGGDFELVERDIPEPGHGEVRIKVEACGMCHSDAFVKDGTFPGIQYPRVPGHEVAGRVDKVGEGVSLWKPGQRVGVGWYGGCCFTCDACRKGDFINCRNLRITGIGYDGGYAEYVTVPEDAVALIPDNLPAPEAAPILCAGVTTFNALRNSGARAGDTVAVQGIGGLGHLGIQYAAKMGFRTIAISSSRDKEELARKLGASATVGATGKPASDLQQMGGASVILATAPNSKAISEVVSGLGTNGKLMVVGATRDPIEVSPFHLIGARRSIQGWPSGSAKDSEETLAFTAMSGIRPMIEKFPLERVSDAYERMMSNKVRFRAVLTM